MISILPIQVSAQVDESVLQDLVIDLGRAKERHAPMVKHFPPWNDPHFDVNAFIRACDEMIGASATMWRYLLDRITVHDGLPERWRHVLCLSVMCRLFQYTASLSFARPSTGPGGSTWGANVVILDKGGMQLSESF